ADIAVRGQNVEFSQGTGLDEFGAFEFPNLAPGKYDVRGEPRGAGFRWPPAAMDGVSVVVGQTTQVKLQLAEGMVVQPQIFGLPALSTAAWSYKVIGVPSGFTMNQKNITELFFREPLYYFNYSTTTASWDKKYMIPGQYDFYLVIGANYAPGPGKGPDRPESYYQFANFIGAARNVSIQKSNSNPNLGLYDQPVPINILGSIGQGQFGGRVTGNKIFSDADFEKIFANFNSEIMPLIPAVMLYDTAGDLRGFGHALPDETAISGFDNGVRSKDKSLIISALAVNPLRYLVWGLPPGRYTVVFANPNYPPLAKEIELPADAAYNFNFDGQNTVTGSISGIVRVAVSSVPLENAQVYLKHRTVEKFAKTNAAGQFSFANLPTGIYRLEVSRDGFVKVGQKTSLAGNDSVKYNAWLEPSASRFTGAVYLGKFPSPSTGAGIKIVAYDETLNVAAPSAYLPKLEAQTDESGNYALTGIIPGHKYKISAFYQGKSPDTLEKTALEGDTVLDDIVLRDIPPQISVKIKKSEFKGKVDVIIKSPKQLVSTPVCKYNPGQVFDSVGAVSLALMPGPNNSYEGRFAVSSNRQYYLINVAAGDGDNRMEKSVVYDQISDAKTEQYIQDAAIAGGEVQMDTDIEEYSGIELDAGGLTTSSGTADFSNLVGGFFSALPSVRTVKTSKGNLTIDGAIRDLMASEVYNMDLSNAQANKPFTLTLKYDKERALNTNGLRIYQYDEASGQWKAVPGNYTVDPMSGVVSVDVVSLGLAYEGTGGTG
ncbi:MAG: carboxypeptidase-like regulatory domain-containing protein, partial [Actinomycetota bacterium]